MVGVFCAGTTAESTFGIWEVWTTLVWSSGFCRKLWYGVVVSVDFRNMETYAHVALYIDDGTQSSGNIGINNGAHDSKKQQFQLHCWNLALMKRSRQQV
jgi:hypothetical protein